MSTAPVPQGTLEDGPRGRELRIRRRIPARIEEVWAAMTESARLQRWIGRWEGDPDSGAVTFFMTAEDEDEDAEPETFAITECEPPRRFAADTGVGGSTWHLRVELSREDGLTRLMFAQVVGEDPLGSIGPGWEYYLDRLVRVLDGEDPDSVDWRDYHPAMSAYYESLAR